MNFYLDLRRRFGTLLMFVVLTSPLASRAEQDCSMNARLDALEHVKDIIQDDAIHENKIDKNGVQVQVGRPELNQQGKTRASVYSVPLEIKVGEASWGPIVYQTIYDKNCVRDRRLEVELESKVVKQKPGTQSK